MLSEGDIWAKLIKSKLHEAGWQQGRTISDIVFMPGGSGKGIRRVKRSGPFTLMKMIESKIKGIKSNKIK